MKISTFFIFLVCSSNSFAWECRSLELQENSINEFPVDSTSSEEHLNTRMDAQLQMASDIILGKIISGEVNGFNIEFEMNVIHAFKGDLSGISRLFTTADPKITLGTNYLLFLHGDHRIDFCSVVINLYDGNISIEQLKERASDTAYYGPRVSQILSKVFGYKP